MEYIILILLGIGSEIVMANNWFVIPEFIPYVLFGLAGFLALVKFSTFLSVRKKAKHVIRRW